MQRSPYYRKVVCLSVCLSICLSVTRVYCDKTNERDRGIHTDSDVSMRSHVTETVSACFAVLRQLRSVRRSVPKSVLQSLVTSLVLRRLDYGNASLAGIPLYLLKRLQSVMNSAARDLCSHRRGRTMSAHSSANCTG